MLDEFVKGYNTLKAVMINTLGDGEEGLLEELDFLDDTLIQVKINYIKKVINLIDAEWKTVSEEKRVFFIERKKSLNFEIAFLASNSSKNTQFCLMLLSDNDDFRKCINALDEYNNGNYDLAYRLFNDYFTKRKCLLEHYLISKVYGQLLYMYKNYDNATIFLRKAVEKRPENIEVHLILRDIYANLNDSILLNNENEIISILKEQ